MKLQPLTHPRLADCGVAHAFGVRGAPPEIDFAAVRDHVHGVIAAIAPHDSVERFEGLGVRVGQAAGRFLDPREVAAGDLREALRPQAVEADIQCLESASAQRGRALGRRIGTVTISRLR